MGILYFLPDVSELYDLEKDPSEMKNLIEAEDYRLELKNLRKKLSELKGKYNDQSAD